MSADVTLPIRIEGTPSLDWSRLILSGRVTVADAGELHRVAIALASRGHGVTVDCSEAEYLDTSAVQVLLALGRVLDRGGHPCDIVGASAVLSEDFRLTGYTGVR